MRPSSWLFLLRVASLLGLSVSIMVLLDYSAPEMAFCSGKSGCGAVRDSGFGFIVLPSGQPLPYLPILGVLNFAGLVAGSLAARARLRRAIAGTLALASGPAGLALLAVQAFVIHHFCSLCLVVDVSALVVFASGLVLRRSGWDEAMKLEQGKGGALRLLDLCVRPLAWLVVTLLAIVGPLAFTSVARTNDLPPAISALHTPGLATVVEFFDYQCPHCRMAIPELDRAVKDFRLPVRVIRQPLSLPGRELGKQAARVHVCAAEQARDEQVLHVLIQGPELTPQNLMAVEAMKSVNHADLLACLQSQRPDGVLGVNQARIMSAGFEGVPVVYIGAERILGTAPYETYLKALEAAATGKDTAGMEPVVYWLQVAAFALFALWIGRVKTAPDALALAEAKPSEADGSSV